MKLSGNNRGIALVTTLMLTLISLMMILALLYIVSQNITTSGAQKRYESSLEAAQGGVDIFSKEIISRLLQGEKLIDVTKYYEGILTSTDKCLNDKLHNTTAGWANCGANATSINAKQDFDVSFTLKSPSLLQPGYTVYSKITDTSPGNSDSSGIDYLDNGSSVTQTGVGTNPKHIPYMYRIEVQGESEKNPKEQAKLSVLYAY